MAGSNGWFFDGLGSRGVRRKAKSKNIDKEIGLDIGLNIDEYCSYPLYQYLGINVSKNGLNLKPL
jgi:hypothetical protein